MDVDEVKIEEKAPEVADTAPEAVGRCGMAKSVAAEAALAGVGGEAAGSAAGEEAALRRHNGISSAISKVDTEAALRQVLNVQLQNHLQLEMTQRERDCLHEAIRSKDAEIERLRRLAYVVEVIDVEAGVTRMVEEAGASPPWKRMRKEQAASARVIGALQERFVEVKREHVEERVVRHSELRASVDAPREGAGGGQGSLGEGGRGPGLRLLLGAPRSWHRCGARLRAHLLQPSDVRLLVGDKVLRMSAADRRTRAALWGACQRVQASAPRRLTRFAVLVALPWPSSVLVFGPPIVPAPLASSGTRHFPCRAGRPRRVIMPMSDIPVQTRL